MKYATFILLLLLGAACNFVEQKMKPATAENTPEGPKGWILHRDPAGYRVALPKGWNIVQDGQSGRIRMQGSGGEQVIIWPAFISGQQLDAKSACVLARQLASKLDSHTDWAAPEAFNNYIRMPARGIQRKEVLLLAWTNEANGSQIYVYDISGPANSYRASADLFAGILDSFRIEKPVAPQTVNNEAASSATNYIRWMEPNENAFTLSVPEGWNIRGGAYRLSATDIRKGVNIFSPDGKIHIFWGDAEIPTFSLPTQMMYQLGLREGSYTALGDGSKLKIRSYAAGKQFAREYVENTLRSRYQNINIISNNERPELMKGMEEPQTAAGIARIQTTGGDASFSCAVNDRALEGYVAAVTRAYYSSIQGGLWCVESIYGVLAPPQQMGQAKAICGKVASSFHVDPGWETRQKQIAAAAVQRDNARSQQLQQRALRAIQEDLHETTGIIVNGYNQRQAVYDEISRKRENAILGTVDVVDPASGKQYKISNYSDYHWMDNPGNITGTKTADSPGLGWRQMIDLP